MFKKIALFLFAVGVSASYSVGAAGNGLSDCQRECYGAFTDCLDSGQTSNECKAMLNACKVECALN
ncbi:MULTISPECIES: hypothetical protein [Janthinobacterium]|uniref:Cys-rich protein n=1 Tax=Janthinobacterium violaceinigrum TaxID=2654252 RepID=A0A6I1I2C1_9BURK|nr:MULTISPECIES: hypothetical protein [Janthinobacterium]KAB8058931.1 hypothetical protein GCN75_27210 [Janthinobacterium violaceinigrum]MCX7292497.1 hypothetical protein [Janthinobacterium sp.]MED5598585.1 hypothetical protein [Janthinobacterium sp. P210006]